MEPLRDGWVSEKRRRLPRDERHRRDLAALDLLDGGRGVERGRFDSYVKQLEDPRSRYRRSAADHIEIDLLALEILDTLHVRARQQVQLLVIELGDISGRA